MPTTEERLATMEHNFERFKAETTTYYQEMALHVTMTKGLSEDAVKRLMQLRAQVDKRFDHTDLQLADVKQEISEVKQDLSGVKQDLSGVKQELNNHTVRLDRLETKMDAVQTNIATMQTNIATMQTNMATMQATLAQILTRLPEKP